MLQYNIDSGTQGHYRIQPCCNGTSQGVYALLIPITAFRNSLFIALIQFFPLGCFQQLMAMRSDALFQDAKAKLMEIRARNTKRVKARTEAGGEKRKKKKQRKSDDSNLHAIL